MVLLAILLLDKPGGRSSATSSAAAAIGTAPSEPVNNCPSGYAVCTDKKFTHLKGKVRPEGPVAAFAKHGLAAHRLCCKYMNATADIREGCQDSIRKHRMGFFWGLIGASMLKPLNPVLDMIFNMTVGNVLMGAIASKTNTAPMRDCCSDAGFNKGGTQGVPANSIVVKEVTDASGRKDLGAWQTENGCPMVFGTPDTIQYSEALADALLEADGHLKDYDVKIDGPSGPDCKGCMRHIDFDSWMSGGKRKIKCRLECPLDLSSWDEECRGAHLHGMTADLEGKAGKCALVCDTSDKKGTWPHRAFKGDIGMAYNRSGGGYTNTTQDQAALDRIFCPARARRRQEALAANNPPSAPKTEAEVVYQTYSYAQPGRMR
jgi:hypothetical protein